MSDVSNNVDNTDRPKVTSVKVRTKGGTEIERVLDSISFYTEGQDYSEYADSLSTIDGISITYNSTPVIVPIETFFQTTDPDQGFEEGITTETETALQNLNNDGHDVLVDISYNDGSVEPFSVPMSFEF